MKKVKSLNDLFVDQIKDLYYSEKQLVKVFPKISKKVNSPQLREVLDGHLRETEEQILRLEKIFEEMNMNPRAKASPAMDGLIEEAKMIIEDAEPSIMDVGIIAAVQKIEHYEIATYGCVKTYARLLGFDRIHDLLDENIKEEGSADKKLTSIAEEINSNALQAEEAEEE